MFDVKNRRLDSKKSLKCIFLNNYNKTFLTYETINCEVKPADFCSVSLYFMRYSSPKQKSKGQAT